MAVDFLTYFCLKRSFSLLFKNSFFFMWIECSLSTIDFPVLNLCHQDKGVPILAISLSIIWQMKCLCYICVAIAFAAEKTLLFLFLILKVFVTAVVNSCIDTCFPSHISCNCYNCASEVLLPYSPCNSCWQILQFPSFFNFKRFSKILMSTFLAQNTFSIRIINEWFSNVIHGASELCV